MAWPLPPHRRRRRGAAAPLALAVLALCAAPPAGAAGLTQQTGRIEVNAMEYPWSAIGRVNAGGRGHCTGFLIGEASVLTAAHCLYDQRDGRWRAAEELHFVAGYQRDTYLIHSPVARYERARDYAAGQGARPGNAVRDWAVLTLARPIGRQAGWLGLRRLDQGLLARLGRGEARLLQAGYRQGWTHIMSLGLGCAVAGFFEDGRGIAHRCDVAKGDSGSPLLVLVDGTLCAVGLHVLDAPRPGAEVAGALSLGLFHPQGGARQAVQAARRAGATWGAGRAPDRGSPAAALPVRTIEQLLGELGYLDGPSAAGGAARRSAAIAAFQARTGLPVTGEPSLALLERLIAAVR